MAQMKKMKSEKKIADIKNKKPKLQFHHASARIWGRVMAPLT